jgi:peptidoglycan/LPS O-acetylase OafA/YrhL
MTMASSENLRYRSLDFWRGVACLLIIVFHTTFYTATESLDGRFKQLQGLSAAEGLLWATSRFWIGVPMFFVISGYCIAAAADSHRLQGLPLALYFKRRFRRIYPPLWLSLAILVSSVAGAEYLWTGIFADDNHPVLRPWEVPWYGWFSSLTLTETWRRHFIEGKSAMLFAHLWTLCYEEQFYIAVGALLAIGKRRFFTAALGLTVWVLLVCAVIPLRFTYGFFFDGLWLQFAAGMAVFYAIHYCGATGRRLIVVTLMSALAYQLRNLGALTAFLSTPAQSFTVAFAFALLLLFLRRRDHRIHGARWARPVARCGQMCYSVYLAHWPIAKLLSHMLFMGGAKSAGVTLALTVPLSLTVCLVAGWGFHRTIERRFLNGPPRRSGRTADKARGATAASSGSWTKGTPGSPA